MKKLIGIGLLFILSNTIAQVDTSFIYKTGTPYGTLDLRLAKSPTQFYYLQENKTMSYRESSPGVRTDSYLPMTSWNTSVYTQGNLREVVGAKDNFIMNYRLLSPVGYNTSYSPGYPLVLMLHGLGERGNCWGDQCYHANSNWNYNTNNPPASTNAGNLLLNNDHNLSIGGSIHLEARNLAGSRLPDDVSMPSRAFPGFVLFPQNLNGWNVNTVHDAIRIIRLIIKKYNIDENRIYIHGISNGGSGTFEAIKRAPWLFAGALTMSPISDASIISQGLASSVAHIPMWIFQGGKDKAPKQSYTESNIKKLREAGVIVRYTLYPNLGHGTWNTAYKEPDFFSWMLSKNKTEIHTYANNTAICLTNSDGVKLEVANGFFLYQWQKDGITLEGETSSSVIAKTPGQYRARFSRVLNPTELQWNPWSSAITLTQQTPAQAQVEQIGTLILPDLNDSNIAKLKALDSAAHYYWYRDETLVDFAGPQDDTIRYASITSGNGNYTLVTTAYDNCPSPTSVAKHIFFSNQAPVNINAPINFAGQVVSTGSIKLTWNDVSTNEGGFEIWSRKVLGESLYSAWQMKTLTGPDVVSFTDAALEPLTTYQYKIRAVSNAGRSDYTPVAADQFLTIETMVDNVAPSAPQNFSASLTGINSITFTWSAAEDNIGIRNYHIFYNDTEYITTNPNQLFITLTDFKVNTIYNFIIKAQDLGGNLSAESKRVTVGTFITGFYYEHSTGVWSSLDEIDWSIAEFKGKIDDFSLTPKTQDDYFNFKFDGYLDIKKEGLYRFSTSSSDGSRVMLDSVVVVNNDGLHIDSEVVGEEIWLDKGLKRIIVTYFEYEGAEALSVKYKGPDTDGIWLDVSTTALVSGVSENNQSEQSFDVYVYPNPAPHNNINIEVHTKESAPIQVNIIDCLGKSVYSANNFSNGNRIVPFEKLHEGIYLINVIQNKKSVQCKMVIQ